jgi:hypothetical protein
MAQPYPRLGGPSGCRSHVGRGVLPTPRLFAPRPRPRPAQTGVRLLGSTPSLIPARRAPLSELRTCACLCAMMSQVQRRHRHAKPSCSAAVFLRWALASLACMPRPELFFQQQSDMARCSAYSAPTERSCGDAVPAPPEACGCGWAERRLTGAGASGARTQNEGARPRRRSRAAAGGVGRRASPTALLPCAAPTICACWRPPSKKHQRRRGVRHAPLPPTCSAAHSLAHSAHVVAEAVALPRKRSAPPPPGHGPRTSGHRCGSYPAAHSSTARSLTLEGHTRRRWAVAGLWCARGSPRLSPCTACSASSERCSCWASL